jgi:serine protease Do
MRKIAVLSLLGLLAWGAWQGKFSVKFPETNPFGLRAAYQPKPIEPHPEVLNLQESFSKVADAIKPAVVNIATTHVEQYQSNPYEFFFMNPEDLFEQFFDQGVPRQRRGPSPQEPRQFQRKIPGTGSGVIIDPDGYILTNEHVVRGADEIKVTIADSEKKYDGKVIGRDERTDLAVVKIKSSEKLPYAKLGNSAAVRVGDWAIAIGSPFGLAQTVTVGVISASRQNLSIENRNYKDLIQTDAAINPGNSGGPLVNIRGEVIGINTAIYTPSGGFAGIGFAIPIDRAKEIIPQLREKGKVIRGWIGVILEEKIDDATANVFGVPDKEGALIREVLPDYPAAKAGLKRGDIIREFNGQKIKNNSDLQTFVQSAKPGSSASIKVIRNKKEIMLTLPIEEAPNTLKENGKEETPKDEKPSKDSQSKWMGASVTDLSQSIRERAGIPDKEKGVFVTDVDPQSKAEEMGLAPGDVIRAVNQEPTPDLKTFKEIVKTVRSKNGIVVDILRRGTSLYLSYMGPEK